MISEPTELGEDCYLGQDLSMLIDLWEEPVGGSKMETEQSWRIQVKFGNWTVAPPSSSLLITAGTEANEWSDRLSLI